MPPCDAHTALTVLGLACFGGLLGLDRTAAGQCMLSQPIVAAPLTGWLLGDLTAGIVIGAVLELIWVLDMPVGTFVPADATVSAVSATSIAALGSAGSDPLPLIGFCVLLTVPMAPVTMKADGFIRRWNSRLTDSVLADQRGGVGRALARAQAAGLSVFFLKSFVLCLVFVTLGVLALPVFRALPEKVLGALSLFVKLLPLLGTAVVARKMSIKTVDFHLLGGFAIAAAAGCALHAPAFILILLAAAGGCLEAVYRERHAPK